MSVFIDPDRLMTGLARSLRRRVLPALPAGNAQFTAKAAFELLAHWSHRRNSSISPPDKAAAVSMSNEVRRLTAGDVSGAAAHRLTQILHEDSRFYREDDAAYRELLSRGASGQEQEFATPNDAELTEVLRRLTRDSSAEARIAGRAVGGYSKQTIFFDRICDGDVMQRCVMRRDLPFAAADRSSVTNEFRVLAALFSRGLAVAEPLLIESDASVLGTPFLVSQRMPGELLGDSLGLHAKVEFDTEKELAGFLAKLHGIDTDELDLPGISDSRFDIATQQSSIRKWMEVYRNGVTLPSAALEIGLEWLLTHAPLVTGKRTLVHGDFGYHNILFDQEKITAVLDWELVHSGHPAEDVAYAISFIDRREDFLNEYLQAGGVRPSDGALTYCRIFGNIRNAIYGVVGMRQFNDGLHDDVSMLPIILSSYASYVTALDRTLSQAIGEHGFRWT